VFLRAAHPRGSRLAACGALLAAIASGLLLAPREGSDAAETRAERSPVLPCGRAVILTTVYRADGLIRFEGVVEDGLRGRSIRIERDTGATVARAIAGRDGTFRAQAPTAGRRYTWLSRFFAIVGGERSRKRRLGQAVALRARAPGAPGRIRITVKTSGDRPDRIVVGPQTGCTRYEVEPRFKLGTNRVGVARFSLPRPAKGEPYAIYRASTTDGVKISPPLLVRPQAG